MNDQRKGLVAIVAVVGSILLVGALVFAMSHDQKISPPQVAVADLSLDDYYRQLQIAYDGTADPNPTTQTTVSAMLLGMDTCMYVTNGDQSRFLEIVEYNGLWSELVAAGGILRFCSNMQNQAIQMGLNPAAFDRFLQAG